MWYSSIYFSAMNAHANRKFESLDKALARLEQATERADKKDLLSMLRSVDGMLRFPESRAVLFDELSQFKQEYRCLGELYNAMQGFRTQLATGQTEAALQQARQIHGMLAEFNATSDEEKKVSSPDPTRESMMEDMQNEYLKQDVRALMRGMATGEMLGRMAEGLESAATLPQIGAEVLPEIEAKLVQKIKLAANEVRASSDHRIGAGSIRLLTIPMVRFRESLRWSAPSLLYELGMRPDRRLRTMHTMPDEDVKIPPQGRATISEAKNMQMSNLSLDIGGNNPEMLVSSLGANIGGKDSANWMLDM